MLKILLVVVGVWFSLAFLFVLALVAAARKSIPSETVVAESLTPAEAAIPQEALEQHPVSMARPARRKSWWRMGKPVRV